jgi:hypothetical protein
VGKAINFMHSASPHEQRVDAAERRLKSAAAISYHINLQAESKNLVFSQLLPEDTRSDRQKSVDIFSRLGLKI